MTPQLRNGWQHSYLSKTWPSGSANEQSMYFLMSMMLNRLLVIKTSSKQLGPDGIRLFTYIILYHKAFLLTGLEQTDKQSSGSFFQQSN